LPTDSRSTYFCSAHYHDGVEYRTIRRMEHWSETHHGVPLADLVHKREKELRAQFRANPELYIQGKTAAAFRGQMLRQPNDVMELIPFLVGKHEPPPYEIMDQIAIIVLAIIRRNETWRQIMDEYRTPRGGRPAKDIDESLPEAKALLAKGKSIRDISKIMKIPYSTLRRRLSK